MSDGAEVLQFMTAAGQLTFEIGREAVRSAAALAMHISSLMEKAGCTGQVRMSRLTARYGVENLRHHLLDADRLAAFSEGAKKVGIPYALVMGRDRVLIAICAEHEEAFQAALSLGRARPASDKEAQEMKKSGREPPTLEQAVRDAPQQDEPFTCGRLGRSEMDRLKRELSRRSVPNHLYSHSTYSPHSHSHGAPAPEKSLLVFPSSLRKTFEQAMEDAGLHDAAMQMEAPKIWTQFRESLPRRLRRVELQGRSSAPVLEHAQMENVPQDRMQEIVHSFQKEDIPLASRESMPGFSDILIAASDKHAASRCLRACGIEGTWRILSAKALRALWYPRHAEQVARLDTLVSGSAPKQIALPDRTLQKGR